MGVSSPPRSGTAPNSTLSLTLDWALGGSFSPDFPEDWCEAPVGCGGFLGQAVEKRGWGESGKRKR